MAGGAFTRAPAVAYGFGLNDLLATYKQLEGVAIETQGWQPVEAAVAEIASSAERFHKR